MKNFVVTSDIHQNYAMVSKVGDYQLQVMAGDLSSTGYSWGFYFTFMKYSNNPLFLSPGNHDRRWYDTESIMQREWTYSQRIGNALFISCFIFNDTVSKNIIVPILSSKNIDKCMA